VICFEWLQRPENVLAGFIRWTTGASGGIGSALVRAYRTRGDRVVAMTLSEMPADDGDVLVVSGDIAERKTAERAISQGLARFGRIDTLINNPVREL
jgi:NAD(P)-dependent dehydrogenase (short-subunit alcohol dehydrogenase family)